MVSVHSDCNVFSRYTAAMKRVLLTGMSGAGEFTSIEDVVDTGLGMVPATAAVGVMN